MAGIRRRRLSSDARQALVDRQQTSGLTVDAFCLREAVSAASFYRWRGRQRPGAANLISAGEPARDRLDGFLDLGAIASRTSPLPSSIRLLLQIGGVRLQFERG